MPGTKKSNPVVGCLALIAVLVLIGLAYTIFIGGSSGDSLGTGDLGGGGQNTITATTGQRVTVNGVELTMLEAAYLTSLEYQEPPAGSIYVAFKFKVRAVSEQHFVGINNFTVASDGTQQGQFGVVVNSAWEPFLALDQVNPGNTLTGWITFTVPRPTSYVLLTYKDNLFSGATDAQWKLSCCK